MVSAIWMRQCGSILLLALFAGVCLPLRLSSQDSVFREVPEEGTLQPARRDASPEQIFSELMRRNELRNAALRSYSAVRSYAVTDLKGKVHAEKIVRLDYRAP